MMTIGEQSSEPSLNVTFTLYHFRQVYKTSQSRGKLKDGGGPVVSPSSQKRHKHIVMQWKERRGKKAVLTVPGKCKQPQSIFPKEDLHLQLLQVHFYKS